MSGCNGVCKKYQATKQSGTSRYAAGQKRCQICEIFMNVEGLWCPCCGYRLRSHPRHSINKQKLRDYKAQQKDLEEKSKK